MDATNDPFTMANDSPRWGFHGAWIAHYLAAGNDKVVQATVSNGGALQTLLKAHASLHANGSVSVMVTNTSPSTAANVTVNVTGVPGVGNGCLRLERPSTRLAVTVSPERVPSTMTSSPTAKSVALCVWLGVPNSVVEVVCTVTDTPRCVSIVQVSPAIDVIVPRTTAS